MTDTEFDLSEMDNTQEVDFPDLNNAGPALTGRTPILGSVRRSNGMPVLRDELGDEFEI